MDKNEQKNKETIAFFDNFAKDLGEMNGKNIGVQSLKTFKSNKTVLFKSEKEAEKAGKVNDLRAGNISLEDIDEDSEEFNNLIDDVIERSIDELFED